MHERGGVPQLDIYRNLQTAIIGVADLEVVWLEMEQIPYCGGKLGGNFGFVHDQAIFTCL